MIDSATIDNRKQYYLYAGREFHRPLMVVVGLMVVLAAAAITGLVVDDRVLLGVPIWEKPLKFALSFILYGTVLALLIPLLNRAKRLANVCGNVIAITWIIEMVIIVGQVIRGRASHFNGTTPFDAALFTTMGVVVAVLWFANLVIAILLWRHTFADRALGWSVRLGVTIALLGAAIGAMMTGPRDDLPADLVGAHTVGLADGGPSLPFVGWSSVGGDLRIGHFVGMHALQVLPLVAVVLALLARRLPRLASPQLRTRLVAVASAGYLGLTILVTWQALRAEPLHRPSETILIAGSAMVIAVLVATAVALRRSSQGRSQTRPKDVDRKPLTRTGG